MRLIHSILFILSIVAASAPTLAEEAMRASIAKAASGQNTIPPVAKRKLLPWLTAGNYLEKFTAEPEVHPSQGPHGGNVRTYFNPILTADLLAGKTVFSKGAAMVKELYLNGTEDVAGYAVMVKTRKNSGKRGQGWVFYETYGSQGATFYGRGLSICSNCHRGGVDYLLSEFRPAAQ